MAQSSGDEGCGCLILLFLAFVIGGGFWQGIGVLAGSWVAYLIFIGVSVGIATAIAKAIAGD